jgi:hypothetical protein
MINPFSVNPPIKQSSEDILHMDIDAEYLSKQLFYKDENNDWHMYNGVLGISGQLGSGKSSFLVCLENSIRSYIENQDLVYNANDAQYEANLGFIHIPITEYENEENILIAMLVYIVTFLDKNSGGNSKYKDLVMALNELIKIVDNKYLSATYNLLTGIINNHLIFDEVKEKLDSALLYLTQTNPLIIFVDDLDRCSPSFVIKFFEQMRYLFHRQERILFILTYDKIQITSFVKTKFGSDIDIASYLQKYISFEYMLGRYEKNINQFFDKFKNNTTLADRSVEKIIIFGVLTNFEMLYNNSYLSLRKLEHTIERLISTLSSNKFNLYATQEEINIFTFLLFLRVCHLAIYDKLKYKLIGKDEITNKIDNLIGIQYLLEHDIYKDEYIYSKTAMDIIAIIEYQEV